MNKKEFIKKYPNGEKDHYVMHVDHGFESISTDDELENELFEKFIEDNDCENVRDFLDFYEVIRGYEDNYGVYTYAQMLLLFERQEELKKLDESVEDEYDSDTKTIRKVKKLVEETFGELGFTKEEIKMDKNFVTKLNKILEEENE